MNADLRETMNALMTRSEPPAGTPAAPGEGAPSNASTPTHIGAAPPASVQSPPAAPLSAAPPAGAPVAPAGTPAAPAGSPPPLSYEELHARTGDLRVALGQARQQLRVRDQTIEDMRTQMQAMAAQVQALAASQQAQQQQAQQQQQPALTFVDPNAIPSDPLSALEQIAIGYNALLQERVEADRQFRLQQQAQQERARIEAAQSAGLQAAANALIAAEQDFKALVAPDYDLAAEHYVQKRIEMLELSGDTRENAVNAVQWELLRNADLAQRQGIDPARAIYEAAISMGYQPRRMPAPAPSYAPPVQTGVDPRLANIQAGQQAASPISAAPGGGGSGNPLDLAAINGLSGAAFTSAAQKMLRAMRGLPTN